MVCYELPASLTFIDLGISRRLLVVTCEGLKFIILQQYPVYFYRVNRYSTLIPAISLPYFVLSNRVHRHYSPLHDDSFLKQPQYHCH